MRLEQLDTPSLIVDMDVFDDNVRTMEKFMDASGLVLRPHYKSHKSTAIAHMQIAAGAKGISCAKLGEAEDLVAAGFEDVLIANQLVEPWKLARVASLAACCRLTICVDDLDNIKALETAAAVQGSHIHCLVEYEVGMRRCGVNTPEEALVLAQAIDQSPHLTFEGIQAYAGHLSHEEDYEKRKKDSAVVEQRLSALCDYLRANGLPVKEVSGASTGTVEFRPKNSVYTEVQAGSYIFMDAAYAALSLKFRNALFVVATVMEGNDQRLIVDAGRKSISMDQKMPVFRDFPNLPVKISEEHSSIPAGNAAAIGDRLLIIPGHCCTCVNLHDFLYLVRGERVVDRIPVTSRGKSF
jgi:D-serine deaminase-like pyridoxal phosphate-dependent protein